MKFRDAGTLPAGDAGTLDSTASIKRLPGAKTLRGVGESKDLPIFVAVKVNL